MRKLLSTLIILLCMAAALVSTAHARNGSTRIGMRLRKIKVPSFISPLSTDCITADSILQFAQTLIGTPYRTATSNPLIGFDCSGFVSYVFKKFNFNVPRSSYDFANVGEKVRLEDAKPGDIILFTGTKGHSRKIGHVGIVYCNGGDDFQFIHSTSGKEHGVTITTMDKTYRHRFVNIIRLLKQNVLSQL